MSFQGGGNECSPRYRRICLALQNSQACSHRRLPPRRIGPWPFAHQDTAGLASVHNNLILAVSSEPDRHRSGKSGVPGT